MIADSGLGKQDQNFWYFTGVESPYAILVMAPGRTALFLPEPYQFAGERPVEPPTAPSDSGQGRF